MIGVDTREGIRIMTTQTILFREGSNKAPLNIDVPDDIDNKILWAINEFIRRGANLAGANLKGTNLKGTDFSEANLSGANLTRTNLSWANLTGADLSWANLITLPIADGHCGWAWRKSEGSPVMISYGCHHGERSLSLSDARIYWSGRDNRREICAALDYAESVARIKGWWI